MQVRIGIQAGVADERGVTEERGMEAYRQPLFRTLEVEARDE